MVETCVAVLRPDAIAEACADSGVTAWVIGSNMRCRLDVERAPLAPALALAVIAARSRQLTMLDGAYNELEHDAGFERQSIQGAAFGFDGKTPLAIQGNAFYMGAVFLHSSSSPELQMLVNREGFLPRPGLDFVGKTASRVVADVVFRRGRSAS